MRVKVYRNLHKKCWSVLGPEGRVILRTPRVAVLDADFVVRQGGRLRVLETGRKAVHAFVVGTLMTNAIPSTDGMVPVTYNPRLNETFIRCDDGAAIHCAGIVILDENGRAYART